jgi:mono/diheme cytochrome c family protein
MSTLAAYSDIIAQMHVISVTLFLFILFIRVVVMGARSETVIEKFNKRVRIPNLILGPVLLLSGFVLLAIRFSETGHIQKYMLAKLALVALSLPLAAIGRRRKNLSLVGIALVCYGLAMALAFFQPGVANTNATADESLIEPDSTKPKPPTNTVITEEQRLLLEGKQVFLERGCGSCHGVSGFSGFQTNKNLEASKLTDDQVIQVITEGREAMPPLRKKIPEEEMKALVAFIKSLRKEKPSETPPPDLSR